MKFTIVEDKKTGIKYTAEYAPNRLGNMRYWVEGKFYSDKDFDRKFKIVEVKYY